MLVTDVQAEMRWLQLRDVGDDFGLFGHQGHQHSKDVTNIHKSSPNLSHRHNDVTNITVTKLSTYWES